jgi:hypothetical protein
MLIRKAKNNNNIYSKEGRGGEVTSLSIELGFKITRKMSKD